MGTIIISVSQSGKRAERGFVTCWRSQRNKWQSLDLNPGRALSTSPLPSNRVDRCALYTHCVVGLCWSWGRDTEVNKIPDRWLISHTHTHTHTYILGP